MRRFTNVAALLEQPPDLPTKTDRHRLDRRRLPSRQIPVASPDIAVMCASMPASSLPRIQPECTTLPRRPQGAALDTIWQLFFSDARTDPHKS
ncbi:MAG: hypothetical protein IJF82_10075 [Achromobacter sp.]|uniref:hypothetical protein n=1 Tax=Achromobacter dolens TaxID=1287738 RepID=UPI0013C2B9D1|nr:hypothetical protein [Achromobacter dolens]MBQ2647704.1 hypothetical protein [Achromobacter sp.]